MADEEIEALESIFCAPGEMNCIKGVNSTELIFHTGIEYERSAISVQATFTLSNERYPEIAPDISLISNDLKREELSTLRKNMLELSEQCCGEPMIMDLLLKMKNNISDLLESKSTIQQAMLEVTTPDNLMLTILHLDHMRAKAKYVKTICKWTSELNLKGRLIFHEKLILLLLEGSHENTKEYIRRNRTVSVDVDSRGHSCKERMLSLVAEKESGYKRFPDFQVLELSSLDELETLFLNLDLKDIYDDQVLKLFRK